MQFSRILSSALVFALGATALPATKDDQGEYQGSEGAPAQVPAQEQGQGQGQQDNTDYFNCNQEGQYGCVDDYVAQCIDGHYIPISDCEASGEICALRNGQPHCVGKTP
jgi:hypothetical protein